MNLRVNELIEVVEDRKEHKLKDYLATDFSVAQKFNKTKFLLFIRYHFQRNKHISISLLNRDIIFNGSSADVVAEALVVGASEWLPERVQRYKVESRWKKENGDWVMSRLRWTRL